MKETEQDRKMESSPMFIAWRNVVKMSILLKEIYRFSVIPIKTDILQRTGKNPKIHM